MKVFNVEQIKQADRFTILNEPIASIDLMERAANQMLNAIAKLIDDTKEINIFCGPGNNGGDGLALARLLSEKNYKVKVFIVKISDTLSEDAQINYERLNNYDIETVELDEFSSLPQLSNNNIIIDALFGSGLNRPLQDFAASVTHNINSCEARVISIDIPSGLFAEDNTNNIYENIIQADFTLSLQFPKLAFFFANNYKYVGEWEIIPIGLHEEYIANTETDFNLITENDIAGKLIKRKRFDHKGKFGHANIISGSYGKIGAAVLASKACLRSGVGLLTVHIPRFGYEIIQTAVPEAMVSIDRYDKVISKIPPIDNYSAIGVGPGIGKSHQTTIAVKDLLSKANSPLILDADALNIISENHDFLSLIPPGSIITPHIKEFDRLVGTSYSNYERLQKQIKFSQENNIVVVLKGAFTSICSPDGKCVFNSTGNPGMAKGGSGDILLGIIVALFAQGYSSSDAATIAVYLHGLAADIAVKETSEEALLSSDIVDKIGKAFRQIKEH